MGFSTKHTLIASDLLLNFYVVSYYFVMYTLLGLLIGYYLTRITVNIFVSTL